jgi:CheY-like chemotaxis protein
MNVLLPLLEESQMTLLIDQEKSEVPGGSESILVVDDEPMIAELIKKHLAVLGYQVTAFTSPIEAMKAFERSPDDYDLVITDQSMPDMTGDLLAKKMLLIRPALPIIVCTGHSDVLDQAKATSIGIKTLLLKPVEGLELAQEVRKAIDKSLSEKS